MNKFFCKNEYEPPFRGDGGQKIKGEAVEENTEFEKMRTKFCIFILYIQTEL